jgi:Ca2+-dependent lipid-binding protein
MNGFHDYSASDLLQFWSMLTITIRSATELKDVEHFSKPDPYVDVEYCGQKLATEVVNNSFNPKWNQKLHFIVGEYVEKEN